MAITRALRISDTPLPGKGYPPLAAFQIPVTAQLVYAGFMGQGLTLAAKNYAAGQFDASIFGTATDNTGFIDFGNGAYLDTGLQETAACTFMVMAKKNDATSSAGIMGTYVGPTNSGVGMFFQSGNMQAAVEKVGGQTTVALPVDITKFQLYSLVVPSTGAAKIVNESNGGVNTSGDTTARKVTGTEPILIGGLNNPDFQQPVQIALALKWSRALTDAERTTMVTWARDYAAARGITV